MITTAAKLCMISLVLGMAGLAQAAPLTADASKASCWKDRDNATIVVSDYKAVVNGRRVGSGEIRPAVGKTLITYSTPRSSMFLEIRHNDIKTREASDLCRAKKNCIAYTDNARAGNDQIYKCLLFK